jgi:hypothetical protein
VKLEPEVKKVESESSDEEIKEENTPLPNE